MRPGPARLLGATTVVVMVTSLAYALAVGDVRHDAPAVLDNPWAAVTLVEAYVGFFLFAAWILQRERRRVAAAAWIVSLMLLGNVVAGAYVLAAARDARGERVRFWLGASSRD